MDHEVGYPRVASRGRTFVYVLPCRDTDLLKVGFSRDPLQRMHALHRRFFEFFDLDRGLLIETGHLRDARRIERLFITTFAAQQAPAPLAVRQAAAGQTEWYRGIHPQVVELARHESEAAGLLLHWPLRTWLQQRFASWSDRLFDWSAQMLAQIEYERFNVAPAMRSRAEATLAEVLDTYAALDALPQPRLPEAVWEWHRTRHAVDFR